jgi:hypothetical protein
VLSPGIAISDQNNSFSHVVLTAFVENLTKRTKKRRRNSTKKSVSDSKKEGFLGIGQYESHQDLPIARGT